MYEYDADEILLVKTIYEYYKRALESEDHIAYLVAFCTLDLLIKAAKEQGVSQITLEATAMGRPLYEKFGFVRMEDEKELIP